MENKHRPGAWTPAQYGKSAIKEYIEPGATPLDLHMRGRIPTVQIALAISKCEARYERFHNFVGLQWLRAVEALLVGVQGERIKETTDMLTGRDRDHKNPQTGMRGLEVESYRPQTTQGQ